MVLTFTGHLRETCFKHEYIWRGIVNQTHWCRSAFGDDECHVIFHIWSTLDKDTSTFVKKPSDYHSHLSKANASACLDRIRTMVGGSTTARMEDQILPDIASPQRWGAVGEKVDVNMRMQAAGIGAGLKLARRTVRCSDAVVRMRADLGTHFFTQPGKGVFLNEVGWANVRRRAELAARGGYPSSVRSHPTHWAREIVTCRWPRLKLTDVCLWSAPPEAFSDMIEALQGTGFDGVVHERNCSGQLKEEKKPAVSENILVCAMHEVNASWSRRQDQKPFYDM